eukprot:CAMPEP_0115181564 /NCGR_PEP_ID=MMETSP0270-20121206/7495_1 /TAXON_ID=71861 /ORGANISM="Scrippsiella trochoidea, Strain CCMP3099" /LENGTH=545 /DNA_ID=CAMNT_0002594589 /DNA_START=42 /DNA_END=1679 /DNA_ORIENTATION=-
MPVDRSQAAALLVSPLLVFSLNRWATPYIWDTYGENKHGHQYLNAEGVYWNLLVKSASAFLIFNMLSHNLPKMLKSEQNLIKSNACGFQGASSNLFPVSLYSEIADPTTDVFFPSLSTAMPRQNGLSNEAIREAFTDGDGKRALAVTVAVGQLALNTAFIVLNVRNLPPRDPLEPLNEAKYYLCFTEATILGCLWLEFVRTFVMSIVVVALNRPSLARIADIMACVNRIADFSVFKFIMLGSPSKLVDVFGKACDETVELGHPLMKYIAGFFAVLGTATLGLIGAISMAVKVSQLDFVSSVLYWDYSPTQIIRIAGFASNVAGVVDVPETQKKAIEHFLVQDKELALMSFSTPMWTAWHRHLAIRICTCFGEKPCRAHLKAILVLATLTARDLKRLFVHQDACVPSLLHDVLTSDRATQLFEAKFMKDARERPVICKQYFQQFPEDAPPDTPWQQAKMLEFGKVVKVFQPTSSGLPKDHMGKVVRMLDEGVMVKWDGDTDRLLLKSDYQHCIVFDNEVELEPVETESHPAEHADPPATAPLLQDA